MNTHKIFLLLFVFCLCFSCGSDDENGEDPNEISCTSQVSFTEDGTEVTLPVFAFDDQGIKPSALFQLKDPSPFDADAVSRILALRLQSGLTVFDIVLELNVDDADSCIPTGTYKAETLSSTEGLLSFTYFKGITNSYLVGLGIGTGTLEITKCDLDNGLVSGNFSGTMGKGFGTETITITGGVFENICIVE